MQIDITFSKERISLPIATSATIQGLLYHALSEDKSYSTFIHENGNICNGKKYKLFCFSELRGKYEIEGKNIVFLSEATLSVRAADSYYIQLLFAYFTKKKTVVLGTETVEIKDIRLKDSHIFDSNITVRTISPITMYATDADGHSIYFTPDDERFYTGIIENARRKWISFTGSENGFDFKIIPKDNAHFKKCATRFKETFITAWHGTFILVAPPQVLDFLFHTGLGSKNSQGFGMFEPIFTSR